MQIKIFPTYISCVGNLDETGLLFKSARKRSNITEEKAKDKDLRGFK